MDLDELPSAGLTDAHYEHLELFPEVTAQAENAAIDALAFESELASSVTAASPAAFSTTASQMGDDIASIAGSDSRPVAKKTPAKKKTAAGKKAAAGLAAGGPAKRPKTTAAAATRPAAARRPKTKPAGAVNGISPGVGNLGRESSSASGSGRDPTGDSDDPGTYCLCLGRDDHRWMICCEKCEDWFHGECISLDKETGESLIEMFICPRCTTAAAERGEELVTRYKKMCALDGCRRPARSYVRAATPAAEDADAQLDEPERTSVFCSAEHCHVWWERIAARLPPASTIPPSVIGRLSREDLLGVLSAGLGTVDAATGTYVLVPRPFSTAAAAGELRPDVYLSDEEKTLLAQWEADRQAMQEEIALCKKMHVLLERVGERQKAAVAAGYIAADICGYDARLDAVGVQAAFAEFAASAEGMDAFSGDSLDAPLAERTDADGSREADTDGGQGEDSSQETSEDRARRLALAGMCDKKRCKAHQGWMVMFHRAVKAQIRQLAEQAQNKSNDEDLVRRAALERFRRKTAERNWVEEVRMDDDDGDMDLD